MTVFSSTRGTETGVTAAHAILKGLASDGGLFVPSQLPRFTKTEIDELQGMTYQQRAGRILASLLPGYASREISTWLDKAYAGFDDACVAPVVSVAQKMAILELWHGPTAAFKDMALQVLPYLLTAAIQKTGSTKEIVILAATSGDTGKAALEGFKDVPGTRIMVFFPEEGVSPMQRWQMITQQGGNVSVVSVSGNFDDAQSGVKRLFSDHALAKRLAAGGFAFSSANSINWGRLAPQVAYYFSAYADLVEKGEIKSGEIINITVPTGNFGNILAGYYARKMGLPIGKLICASNQNNVLTEFITTGVYDRKRPFFQTLSPSMDILLSSNLERLLYHLTDGNAQKVAGWMTSLAQTGRYEVDKITLAKLHAGFAAGYTDDAETKQVIGDTWREKSYLLDPHTAVAWNVARNYQKASGDERYCLIVSTASPYKFCRAVLEAVQGKPVDETNEFALIRQLENETGTVAPISLSKLENEEVRHNKLVEKEALEQAVCEWLDV